MHNLTVIFLQVKHFLQSLLERLDSLFGFQRARFNIQELLLPSCYFATALNRAVSGISLVNFLLNLIRLDLVYFDRIKHFWFVYAFNRFKRAKYAISTCTTFFDAFGLAQLCLTRNRLLRIVLRSTSICFVLE